MDLRELLLELLDFILVFTKEGVLGVLVNAWLVLDVLGTTSIAEGVHGLVVVVVGWTHIRDHNGFSVTT